MNAHEVVCDGLYDSSYREPAQGKTSVSGARSYAYKKIYSDPMSTLITMATAYLITKRHTMFGTKREQVLAYLKMIL